MIVTAIRLLLTDNHTIINNGLEMSTQYNMADPITNATAITALDTQSESMIILPGFHSSRGLILLQTIKEKLNLQYFKKEVKALICLT